MLDIIFISIAAIIVIFLIVVTWTMSGTNNFMAKAVGLFINCEKMVAHAYTRLAA